MHPGRDPGCSRLLVWKVVGIAAMLMMVAYSMRPGCQRNQQKPKHVAAAERQRNAAAVTARWRRQPEYEADFISWARREGIRMRTLSLADSRAADEASTPATFAGARETCSQLEAYLASTFRGWRESTTFRSMDQSRFYHEIAADRRIKNVCETGFNGGHSAVNWLMANPDLHVYSFDLGAHKYVAAAWDWVERHFPGRLTLTLGDSIVEVPRFGERHPNLTCQLLHVDGGHSYEVAMQDTIAFAPMADPDFHVLLMDDTGCDFETSCGGPTQTVEEGVESNVIRVDEYVQAEVAREDAGGYPTHLKPTRGYLRGSYILPRRLNSSCL